MWSGPITRQRVTAYFQRMVQGVGSQVFPYVPPMIEHLRSGGAANDLRECLVLLNQLMAGPAR